MFGLISKRRLRKALEHLEADSAKSELAHNVHDMNWRFGNANAVNYIKYKLNIKTKDDKARDKEVVNG